MFKLIMTTRIVILGDSMVGKTVFAHIATGMPVPLNIYKSTQLEYFMLYGTCTSAEIVVVPGTADKDTISRGCKDATGIIVLYKDYVCAARRWLGRVVPPSTAVPILLCSYRSTIAAGRRVHETLQAYTTAEHASICHSIGIVDCVNRIVTRARRDLASPL
jgi:hypothetical protein